VRVELSVRDLLLASWPVTPESAGRVLPAGLEPVPVDGRHLVTIASFRVTHASVGRLPGPRFSQLNVRVYTSWKDEPAVYFLRSLVTPPGLGGVLLGARYAPARIRVRSGRLDAPGHGVALGYRPEGPGEPQALGRHELGLFASGARLRAFRIRRGPADWRRAAPLDPIRADLLVALGFELAEPPELLYAERASFSAAPPRRIASASTSSSSA